MRQTGRVTERLLEEHLESLGVKVERQTELIAFADQRSHVSCTVRHADGREENVETDWLIGCDGSHSIVRQNLGMAFEGDTLPNNFLLADLHVAGLPVPKDEIAIYWHQDGVVVFFPITADGRYRIIADAGITTEASHPPPSMQDVQSVIAKRVPAGLTLSDPIWLSSFTVNERKVANYRTGRVFVAGDAAHIHSPAGGQGMNTGMQDAFNLAWKLAIVVQGKIRSDTFLDTYSLERSAVATKVLSDSGHMIRVAVAKSELTQLLGNFVAQHVLGFPAARLAMAKNLAEITIAYPDSPLSATAPSGLHGPSAGQRVISAAPFGAGDTPRFALMATESDGAKDVLISHASLLEPVLREPIDKNGIWLIRPDGYVAVAAHAGGWNAITDYLKQWFN